LLCSPGKTSEREIEGNGTESSRVTPRPGGGANPGTQIKSVGSVRVDPVNVVT